jgi:hypothetical protein
MAKRKVKRYNDEGYVTSDDSNAGMKEAYDEGALERANASEAAKAIMDEAKGETILKNLRDEAAKPKVRAASKPASTPAPAAKSTPSTSTSSSSTSAASESSTPSTAKKETYRDFAGKVQVKKGAAERDAEMAARRANVMSGLRNIGSSISDVFSRAKQNYESTRPVSRQVQKEREQAASRGNLAKGGMARSSASKRADGIATKGKTRGKYL